MTADSSISSELDMTPVSNSPELPSPSSPLSLPPPSTLRKSISVDSFINYRQVPDAATRPNRGNTMSAAAKPPTNDIFHGQRPSEHYDRPVGTSSGKPMSIWHEQDIFQRRAGPSSSRGTSISTNTGDEYESSLLGDSDVERNDDMLSVLRKGKAARRRQPQPEELTLPSRLSTVNPSPTMGKPPPIVSERSGGSGHRLTKQRSLISVNTQVPPVCHVVLSDCLRLTDWLSLHTRQTSHWLSSVRLALASLRSSVKV